jgi:hypothetical protein
VPAHRHTYVCHDKREQITVTVLLPVCHDKRGQIMVTVLLSVCHDKREQITVTVSLSVSVCIQPGRNPFGGV